MFSDISGEPLHYSVSCTVYTPCKIANGSLNMAIALTLW